MLAAGVDLFVVSRVLGHTSVATTSGFYGHIQPSQLRDAAARMDAILRCLRNLMGVRTGVRAPNESPSGSAWRGCFVFGSMVSRQGFEP